MVIASGIDDFADQLFLRLVRGVALQALGAAAERGDRALAHLVGVERGDDGQAAALLLRCRLVGGLRRDDGAHRAAGAAANLTRTFVLLRPRRQRRARGRRCRRARGGCRCWRAAVAGAAVAAAGAAAAAASASPKRFLASSSALRLASSSCAMALFLRLAAGFGGFAFGLLDAFAAGAALGFLFGLPPFLDFAGAGIGQRADAGGMLVLGQGLQHHAGRLAGDSRRSRA